MKAIKLAMAAWLASFAFDLGITLWNFLTNPKEFWIGEANLFLKSFLLFGDAKSLAILVLAQAMYLAFVGLSCIVYKKTNSKLVKYATLAVIFVRILGHLVGGMSWLI